jgi:micrococcal nuclease
LLPRMSTTQRSRTYLRKKTILAAVLLLGMLAVVLGDRMGAVGLRTTPDAQKYDGKTFRVSRVVDGDTLIIDEHDDVRSQAGTTIRLWGVDTPETVKPDTPPQHFGKEASDYSKAVLTGQCVRLELQPRTRDKYNRLLAFVYLSDGSMFNRTLVQLGYAYADPRFGHPYKREFASLANQAHKAQAGLWKDLKETDLPDYLRGKVKP